MSTIVTNTSVFTNRSFPFDKIELSLLEKRNRKYYIDFSVQNIPIFLQINKVKLISEPIFIDNEQGYIDVEIQDRVQELANFFEELDNYNQLICYKHCEEWLGKSLEMKDIEAVYKTSYKNQSLRLKIEKETIKMYDMKKNKLSIDSDLKIGDTLDIIMEISGLKLMKSAFSSYIILRQIRKHPEAIIRKKTIPNEYLFLDEYSNRTKINVRDDNSLDDQTDIDMLTNKKKPIGNLGKSKIPIDDLLRNPPKVVNKYDEKEPSFGGQTKDKSKDSTFVIPRNNSQQSSKNDDNENTNIVDFRDPIDLESEQNTNDYLKNITDTMEIENSSNNNSKISEIISRKDKILDALENGDIGLNSVISFSKPIKLAKKRPTNSKKIVSKFTDQQLHKDI